jgi:hypothetical protein
VLGGSTELAASRFKQRVHGRKCRVEYRIEAIDSDDYCNVNSCCDKRVSDVCDGTIIAAEIDVLHNYIPPHNKNPDTTN